MLYVVVYIFNISHLCKVMLHYSNISKGNPNQAQYNKGFTAKAEKCMRLVHIELVLKRTFVLVGYLVIITLGQVK